jgi:glutathione S-transferase
MRARMALLLAGIKCELREVRLNNKPEQMLEVSPKGTVPVLVLENKVIDESNDIINWVLNDHKIFVVNLSDEQSNLTNNLIKLFDEKFKFHLDRYKYATRYENSDVELHRSKCLEMLVNLEKIVHDGNWIFGENINKLDISILPFIRQFRIADPTWFDSQEDIKKLQNVLNNFLESNLFKDIMYVYDVWKKDSEPVFFPITN